MPNGKTARSLSQVTIRPSVDPGAVGLEFQDTKGKKDTWMIGPEGLNALLMGLLGLAEKWSHHPDLAIETLTGPRRALPAKRISFEKGRSQEECAVRVYVASKFEMTFLLPLDDVMSAVGGLAGNIDPASATRPN